MQPPVITPTTFIDVPGMPEVHSDARRTISEVSVQTPDGGTKRTSRSEVAADEVVLGNHYHDFDQHFLGKGAGILYTAPKANPTDVTEQTLPADGWEFDIPAGQIMALRLHKGAVQIFESNKDYQDGSNTHHIQIAEL